MTSIETNDPQGWRVLGFGKHPENATAIQQHLRSEGLRARNFALTNDQEGDDRLIRELTEATYDGVVIGGYINGQDPEVPPTEQTTQWFNRILNIIHTHAPATTIILTRNPPDALAAIERVLGCQRRGLLDRVEGERVDEERNYTVVVVDDDRGQL